MPGVAIKIAPFGPIYPRTAERQLPDLGAQVANNVNLLSGEIRPIKQPLLVSSAMAGMSRVYRAEYGSGEKWRGWTSDVDTVRIPAAADLEPRYAWTGDGPPKWSSYTNFDTVASDLTLGIPNPVTAPTALPAGGVGAADSRLYLYTFFSQNGEESGPSPPCALTTGKVDDTWAISGMDAFPANSGSQKAFYSAPTSVIADTTGVELTVIATANVGGKVEIQTSAAHGLVTGNVVVVYSVTGTTEANNVYATPTWTITKTAADKFTLDGSTYAHAWVSGGKVQQAAWHWLRANDQVVINSVKLVVASIPTPYTFTVAGDQSAYTSWARKANWNTSSMTKRLYRSAGLSYSTYQLVADGITTTTYNDTILDANLPGDELISATWQPPPTNLINMISHPSGALCAVTANTLCFSEPYQPHAWPASYQYGLDQTAVGCGGFGSSIVVPTKGAPYTFDGIEPASMTPQRLDSVWPCLSKLSITSVGDGVIYASSYGIAYVGQRGPSIWSLPFYTRTEWETLNPSTADGEATEGKVFLNFKPTGSDFFQLLVFNPDEPMAALTVLTISGSEMYTDPRNGHLYLIDSTGARQYDAADGQRLSYEWESREFELPTPVNFGAARVEFVSETTAADVAAITAAYNAAVAAAAALIVDPAVGGESVGISCFNGKRGGFNASPFNGYCPHLPPAIGAIGSLTFILYSKGVEVFSRTAFSDEAFRLPSGYKSDAYSIKLNGAVRVKNVKLAETMSGLKAI